MACRNLQEKARKKSNFSCMFLNPNSGHGVQRKSWYLECGLYHGWNDTWWGPFSRHWSYWPVEQMFIFIILTFLADFLIPIFFSNLNSNCSNYLRNLQEQFKKAFCYQKLFWPFIVWINCSIFLTVGQNSFDNKIPFLFCSCRVLHPNYLL